MNSVRNKLFVIVRESIRVPLRLVMSSDHHVANMALKSPKIKVNWDFEKVRY